jgi:hypothetical protein
VTEAVVKSIRGYGKGALFAPGGETAESIQRRSCAPSLTMTQEGFMVKDGKSPRRSSGDRWRHEDLSTLLQNINDIYESRLQPQESFEDFVPTVHPASGDSPESDLNSFHGPPLLLLLLLLLLPELPPFVPSWL